MSRTACRRSRRRSNGAREIGFTVRVDQPVAGRGVHPAAADGRHRRAAVPRIRHHRHGRDRGLGVRLADADADAVLALPASASSDAARPHLPRHRGGVRRAAATATGARSTSCCVTSAITLAVFFATMALTVVLFVDDPEGLLPDAGHRPDHRLVGGRAGRLACRDEAPAADARRMCLRAIPTSRPSARSSAPAARRPPTPARFFIALKPRERAQCDRARRSSTGCARSSPRSRASALFLQPAQDITVGGRIVARPVPIHAAGRRPRRAEHLGAEASSTSCKTLPQLADVSSDQQANAPQLADHHQPRPGRALRHPAAGDRRHAQRCLRPAPGDAVLHADSTSYHRDPGSAARNCRATCRRSTRST